MKTHIRLTFFRGWVGHRDVVVSSLGWEAEAHCSTNDLCGLGEVPSQTRAAF